MKPTLTYQESFATRHIGPSPDDATHMLEQVGADSLEQLIDEAIPKSIRNKKALKLAPALTELEALGKLREIAAKNRVLRSYIGMGYYGTAVPAVIQRNVLENPGWYTQYTPYQAEIAQGRLEALLNFQTLVADLTGMDIANASLLDEATAAAEGMLLSWNASRGKHGVKYFASSDCHPQTLAVLATRAEPLGIELEVGDVSALTISPAYFGVLLQYPSTTGTIQNYSSFCNAAHQQELIVTVATDLCSLLLLTPPGEWGADIVVGSSQRFGVPMGYGGPHAAFFATSDKFKRQLPGRLVGVSIDAEGKQAYRLALQTREQHIRREKATSNICTAQVLLAIMASMYAVYHGPKRLKSIALRIHSLATLLAAALEKMGFIQLNEHYFDTLNVHLGENAAELASALRVSSQRAGINFRYFDDHTIGIALDETTRLEDLTDIVALFLPLAPTHREEVDLETLKANLVNSLPAAFQRQSNYLTHPVFNSYHTETEMLRYIKRLEGRDLSLAHSMIPLGSCTMKLNATTEMLPVTWPEFGNLHPFAPALQAKGYQQLFKDLERILCEVTGFAAVSLQPNSGAQGEYTGLMVIREYFKRHQQQHRTVALIPQSAHGTNPASAVMAGMEVVVVRCDEQGNIDVADLRAKAEQHHERLAALMVTYPSTHGVFEESIKEICKIIHAHGGQVYMDGANMNAQVGLTSPGTIGADVCHLNLHKTFCIPHGGGGPGMGPIGVAKHLAPYLPGHTVVALGEPKAMGPVSAAPWGSASILVISYLYTLMMGAEGLMDATRYAILNANYIKSRLEPYYGVLYQGAHGRVAHELILDFRPFKYSVGIEVEDVAKRLIDYGYHAPTVSFPVAGTMMIEPTESESLVELNRFCDAMIAIRREIQQLEDGLISRDDNPLKNAPHTAAMLVAPSWAHPYSRETAVYPLPYLQASKFWPYVARINNTYGDRNLFCSCPPLENYQEVQFESHAVVG